MKVKFKLPVGALVEGWRHLGGGEFAAVADVTVPMGFGRMPLVLDGNVSGPDDDLDALVIVPFDDPLASGFRKVVFADVSAVEAEAIRRSTGRLTHPLKASIVQLDAQGVTITGDNLTITAPAVTVTGAITQISTPPAPMV